MALSWTHETQPRWDAGKQQVVGGAPAGALKLPRLGAGDPVPGEWWRVEDGGRAVGYGWMDITWEGAEILLAVDPSRQRAGIGTFILDQLEKEAAVHGLEYIFNTVQPTHPDRDRVARWLRARDFSGSDEGQLKRRVKVAKARA